MLWVPKVWWVRDPPSTCPSLPSLIKGTGLSGHSLSQNVAFAWGWGLWHPRESSGKWEKSRSDKMSSAWKPSPTDGERGRGKTPKLCPLRGRQGSPGSCNRAPRGHGVGLRGPGASGGPFNLPFSCGRLGRCQGSDGSEGGRARGLGLGSEVVFSRPNGGTGP